MNSISTNIDIIYKFKKSLQNQIEQTFGIQYVDLSTQTSLLCKAIEDPGTVNYLVDGNIFHHLKNGKPCCIFEDKEIACRNSSKITSKKSFTEHDIDSVYSIDKFSDGLYEIGSGALAQLSNLQYANLNEIRVVGPNGMSRCTSLTSIESQNVTSVKANGFEACYSLQSIDMPHAKTVDQKAFNQCTFMSSINFPELTAAGQGAFAVNRSLISADLPQLVYAGKQMFQTCQHLSVVYMPKAIYQHQSTIGSKVEPLNGLLLQSCPTVRYININNAMYKTIDMQYVVTTDEKMAVVATRKGSSRFEKPSILSVGTYCFSGNTSLTGTTLANATYVGTNAFEGCTSLVNAQFDNIVSADANAFKNCSKMTSIVMPKIKYIGNNAFYGCSALSNLNISSVESIGTQAFYNTKISSLTFTKLTTINDTTLKNASLQELHFEDSTVVPTISNASAFSWVASGKKIRIFLPTNTSLANSFRSEWDSKLNATSKSRIEYVN